MPPRFWLAPIADESVDVVNALAELISRSARQFGGRVALTCDQRSLTFADVEAQSNRLASALASMGCVKGDRVAILLPNCPEFVIADFALIKAGIIRVPVNVRYAAREIEFILDHSGAAAIVVSAAHAELLARFRGRLASLRHVIAVDPTAGMDDAIAWVDTLARGDPQGAAVDTVDHDGYMLGYTSGTTGRPKGALTTVRARWASLFNTFANETFISSADVMLHATSLAHGSGTKVLPFYIKGGRNVLMRRFTPCEFFQLVERERVTTTWLVPTMVAMLVDAAERDGFDCSTLRTIIYGGASMPMPVLERALEFFGPILVQIYGLTEAPHPDLVLSKEDHLPDASTGSAQNAGATGRGAVGVRIRLVDEMGNDVPSGAVGEILVAGEHVMSGYWNDPAATVETLRDGWCHTGDMARVDEQGLYFIVDRKKEMIISGGYNVYPKEVEDVLYRCAAIAECAVIGSPDPLWGETVHAVVVAKPGMTVDADTIAAHCGDELANYKKPRRLSVMSELPKTANGKIDKKALRATLSGSTPVATRVETSAVKS